MTTTKRPYAQPNAQRRSIYTDDDTWATLKDLGKGNASAGIRISALNHGRLVEALEDCCAILEYEHAESEEAKDARLLLREIEATK